MELTDDARRVLPLAREEAQRLGHNYIGTEHLLLAIMREGDGLAARVLVSLGVDLDRVRSAVEFIVSRGDRSVTGDMGLTPRAEQVIMLAVDEARQINRNFVGADNRPLNYVGTEHLLLGLVREGGGIAAAVLQSLDVTTDKVRNQVIFELNRQAQ
jgi:ATP-dependent Clp protease ATP-binding subunit ClpC